MKIKNTALIMAVVILTILLTGPAFCEDYTTYLNSEGRYSLSHPSSWGVKLYPPNGNSTRTAIVAPGDNSSVSAVIVYTNIIKQGLTEDQVFSTIRQNTLKSFKMLQEGYETINGRKAYWTIIEPKNDKSMKMVKYVFLNGARIYSVTGGGTPSSYSRDLPTYLNIIRSIKVD